MEEQTFHNKEELELVYRFEVASCAREIYELNGKMPVKILDFSTVPNHFSPEGLGVVSYEIIFSDISLSSLMSKHEEAGREISEKELRSLESALKSLKCQSEENMETTKLLKGLGYTRLSDEETTLSLANLLESPRYKFLQVGRRDDQRAIDFSERSYDMVIGSMVYCITSNSDYSGAIKESVRFLKNGGYHIVDEMQVENIKSYDLRLLSALEEIIKSPRECYDIVKSSISAIKRAKQSNIKEMQAVLNLELIPMAVYSAVYPHDAAKIESEQTFQMGDIVKRAVLIHMKL